MEFCLSYCKNLTTNLLSVHFRAAQSDSDFVRLPTWSSLYYFASWFHMRQIIFM